jgi:hypothetical protein
MLIFKAPNGESNRMPREAGSSIDNGFLRPD